MNVYGENKFLYWSYAAGFACASVCVLLSPWFFGSWEMWWFWSMSTLILMSVAFAGMGMLAETLGAIASETVFPTNRHIRISHSIRIAAVAAAPFLAYMWIRSCFPSAPGRVLVRMEAGKSMMLFATPVLLSLSFLICGTKKRMEMLLYAFCVNVVLVALYSLVNHYVTHDTRILWTPVDPSMYYGGRATGVFYCPSHLCAYINIGIAVSLAVIFTPGGRWVSRILAVLATGLLLWTVYLTLSRGGIAALAFGVFTAGATFALRGRPPRIRVIAAASTIVAIAAGLLIICFTKNSFSTRIKTHPLYTSYVANGSANNTDMSACERIRDAFWYKFDRGMYIGSALRAWKSNPVWGIGPGQHSNRWAEFAPTDDGSFSPLKFPRLRNDCYHLYEVHSDWTQLLEEYGIVGFSLFLVFAVSLFGGLYVTQAEVLAEWKLKRSLCVHDDNEKTGEHQYQLRRSSYHRHHHDHRYPDRPLSHFGTSMPLAAMIAMLIFAFHSLGDFSLQIPAITWSFSFLITSGLILGSVHHHSKHEHHHH